MCSADFSLFTWKLKKGLDTSSSEIEDPYVLQLMEELGIAAYSKNPMCTISPNNAAGRVNGWTTGDYNFKDADIFNDMLCE